MHLSSEVFSRMCLAAREISGIVGRDVECMGYLLAEKGSSAVTDFYFPEQHGDDAESGTGDFLYRQLYEQGMNITGMWHSHGYFPVFHSPTDHTHVKNRLKAMQRENDLLDAWDAYSNPGSIKLFNKETMQGMKIKLSINYKPEIKNVHEQLPETFQSIVINRDTYNGSNKAYDAMHFSLENNELKQEKAKIDIHPIMATSVLENMANNYTISGLLLKDMPAYRKKASPKTRIKNNAVEITSRYGCFSIKCDNPQELAESIEDVIALSDEELDKYKEKLPKKPNAKDSIENIVNEKQLFSFRQYDSEDPCIEATEMHAFYVGLFLSAIDFYQRSESCKRYMHADKAVIDLFAALSGAVESSPKTIFQLFSSIEESGVPLDVYINPLNEAKAIIEKMPGKKPLLKKVESMLKKAKGVKDA
ncbi:MAG: Mov34/MPN/PAD-1 family protein [Nanoarchaeota archaeon]|nr:Mov34/MPN/PAD-1 family protein [Nanoarchaeota archaeon]